MCVWNVSRFWSVRATIAPQNSWCVATQPEGPERSATRSQMKQLSWLSFLVVQTTSWFSSCLCEVYKVVRTAHIRRKNFTTKDPFSKNKRYCFKPQLKWHKWNLPSHSVSRPLLLSSSSICSLVSWRWVWGWAGVACFTRGVLTAERGF